MPPHAIIPTYRITFPYTVASQQHLGHHFLNVVASADPSGFNYVAGHGGSNNGVSVAMDRLATTYRNLWAPASASFGTLHLDNWNGSAWVPVYYRAAATTPGNPSGANYLGRMLTMSGYTTTHEKTKMFFMEPYKGLNSRYTGVSGDTQLDAAVDDFFAFNATPTADAPWYWQRGRDGNFVNTYVSSVFADNKHWRRKRGLG